MAYKYEDFYKPLLEHLITLDAQQPIGSRRAVFNYFNPPPGSVDLTCQYNPNCWANHLPLKRIAWHDTYTIPFGNDYVRDFFGNPSSLGHGVAITQRHILCSGHGKEVENYELVWAGRYSPYGNPADTFYIKTIDVVKGILPNDITFRDENKGFHVLWLEKDIPVEFVTPLILPSDLPESLIQLPVIGVNQFMNAQLFHIKSDPNQFDPEGATLGPLGSADYSRLTEGSLWQQPITNDSGTPLFLIHNNSDLFFLGNIYSGTNDPNIPSAGAVTYQFSYVNILEACRILTERHANDPPVMPPTKHCTPLPDPATGRLPERCGFRQPLPGPLG